MQFYYTRSSSRESGHYEYIWLPTKYCKDLYADQIAAGEQIFVDEFAQDWNNDWVCPDVSEISLFNDPQTFGTGQNIVMVVNYCDTAQEIDD